MIVRGMKIRKVFATNSKPTIEIDIRTKAGTVSSSVPMGTSTGKHEAVYLPVEDAIQKFAMVSRYFRTNEFHSMEDVDVTLHKIDVTSNFSYIGGNVSIGVSSAFLKAFALEADLEVFEYVYNMAMKKRERNGLEKEKPKMPMPLCNVIGGSHTRNKLGQPNIQEFLLMPVHQKSFSDSITRMSKAYIETGERLENEDEGFMYSKNIESAWATKLGIGKVLEILTRVAGNELFKIGMDVAASNLWDGSRYVYTRRDIRGDIVQEKLIRTEQLNFVDDLARRYPIAYIEDPFEEDDYVSHATLNNALSARNVMVCGDDLYATNIGRLQVGIEHKSTSAVIVKPNQIGTISDAMKFVELAKKNGMKTVMSHRSGETEDVLICHLATGLGCDYVKFGISGERTAKLNEMIRIEEDMM